MCSLLRLCGEDVLEQGDEDDLTVSSLLGGSGVISEEEMSGVSMTSSLPDPLYLEAGEGGLRWQRTKVGIGAK